MKPLLLSFGLAEAVESGLLEDLRRLGVRRAEDLQYLTAADVRKRLPLPLIDQRKFLCFLSSLKDSILGCDLQV